MPTAAAIGRNSVARNVVTMAIVGLAPVRSAMRISSGFTELTAAKMRMAPSEGIATLPTSPDSATRMASIQMPEKMAAQRVRAPAAAFSAVWPTEPPTGWPRKKAAAMLAMPWARKSASMSGGAPSGLGAASETPAPWTSTITATTSAPVRTSAENSMCSGGRAGQGMPVGIAPTSATVATAGSARASRLGRTRAMTEA